MTLTAKPIIKDQYWVVTDGKQKVGNILANDSGFSVIINNSTQHFDSKISIEKLGSIMFERNSIDTSDKKHIDAPFAFWPTTGKTYNNIYDVKRKIHVYTKTPDSKCYYAAGWYVMKLNDVWQTIFCPKYIFIQRYSYHGPYDTQEQAENRLNTV